MKWVKIITLGIVMYLYVNAYGQAYDLSYLKTTNGLSSNNTSCVIMDRSGFLWIGTRAGLNRYDGTKCKIFVHNQAQSNSIGSNNITFLFEDMQGTIWVVLDEGFSKWNKSNHHFTNYYLADWSLPSGSYITRMMDYDADHLFVATNNGVFIFNKHTNLYHKIQLPHNIRETAYFYDGHIWYIHQSTLYKYSIQSKSLKRASGNQLQHIVSAYISYFDPMDDKIVIGSYNKGALIYSEKNDTWQHIAYDRTIANYDPMYGMKYHHKYGIVFNADYTIGSIDHTGKTHILDATRNIDHCTIRDFIIYKDELWIATSQGIIHAKQPKVNLHTYPRNPNTKDRYATLRYEAKDDVFYTSNYDYAYIYTIDAAGKYQLLPLKKDHIKGGLRNIYRDHKDRLWLSTETEVYIKYPGSKLWQSVPLTKNDLPRNFIEDSDGHLFLRVRNKGIYQWNETSSTFEIKYALPQKAETYTAMSMLPNKNKLVLGTKINGLVIINTDNGMIEKIDIQNIKPCKYLDNLHVSNDSIIWLSDAIEGIYKLNLHTNKAQHFTTSVGLLSNNNEAIVEDYNGSVWTFSAEGVNVIHNNGNIQSISHTDLVKLHDITYAKKNVYVINDRIHAWNVDSVQVDEYKPLLYKDYMILNNNTTAWPQQARFKYDENNINLYFGIQSQSLQSIPNFQYKFEEETTWHDIQQSNSISFSKLAPGQYNLDIRIENDENQNRWISANWIIQKPFWKETYFFILMASVLALTIYALWKKSIMDIKKSAGLKQKIAELKTSALRAQMNPHFIFNCLSGIDNFILQNREVDASNYLNKFSKLLRAVLESSKNEIIPFQQDWQTLLIYIELEQMRSGHTFAVVTEADDALMSGHYKIPPMIIQPYIENAIQHGMRKVSNGTLKVTARLTENLLLYTIEDNGPGIPQHVDVNKKHKSYGMDISKERIELFNANENIDNIHILSPTNTVYNNGTRVEVTLKI